MSDRRAVFFLGAAVACFVLADFAGDYTHVAVALGGIYVLLSIASWLDHRSREQSLDQRRRREERAVRRDVPSPFPPDQE
jgi:membrane associated rhomboid family serine protease